MKTDKGFTLIELMITIVISTVIMSAVYVVHISQQNTYLVQEQVAEMQQNLRAAMSLLVSDIRMAGYDPLGTANAANTDIGVTTAAPGRFIFTVDSNGNGNQIIDGSGAFIATVANDPREMIEFGFSLAVDADNDGIPDSGNSDSFMMQTDDGADGYVELAENIDAVEFLYLGSTGAPAATLVDIRAVQITMLARAQRPDLKFNNTRPYRTPGGQVWGAYNDNFRRRMLTTTVRCRNL